MARTDNDRWDLASSVGATATMVATQRALGHRERLIDDPFAEPLVRAVGHDFFVQLLDGKIDLQQADPDSLIRRAVDAMAARTRFFDRSFTDAIASGVCQVVILAAGLDTRAYRLPCPEGTVVFEVDQPEVIEFKTRTLANLGADPTAEHRVLGIDLRDDWPSALLHNAFDRRKPTVWIIEGLLIYLPPDAQDRLFDSITGLSAPGSRLGTEYVRDMSVLLDGRAPRTSDWMKEYGYRFDAVDLVYSGERNDVVDYLRRLGWQVSAQTSKQTLRANGFPLPEDERVIPFGNADYISAVR
jgi:methyltransferase (TIGR00027 family)